MVGASVVGVSVVGVRVVGICVGCGVVVVIVGVAVVGASVVGASVVGASVVGVGSAAGEICQTPENAVFSAIHGSKSNKPVESPLINVQDGPTTTSKHRKTTSGH